MVPDFDVAILGLVPYGLGVGAHLRKVPGLAVKVFGEPMEFWQGHMPEGMLLCSPWAASHIGSDKDLSLEAFRGDEWAIHSRAHSRGKIRGIWTVGSTPGCAGTGSPPD